MSYDSPALLPNILASSSVLVASSPVETPPAEMPLSMKAK